MAKIILKCRYLQSQNSKHVANYIRYIARREGVEHVKDTCKYLPSTKAQKDFILNLMKDFPGCENSFEYKDYLVKPNRENASKFISTVMDQYADIAMKKKNYVDYIATRPGAEKIMEHGLFTDDGVPVVLEQVANEIADYDGNVWTDIISIRREDAIRLGYEHADSWMSLLRSKRYEIAIAMKIKPENLIWYAAYHDEGSHPHVHLIAYSKDPKEAYLTKQGIEQMRSSIAREIFKQDLIQIYEKQTMFRNQVNQKAKQKMAFLKENIMKQVPVCDETKQLLRTLSDRLRHQSGKKQYGYLKKSDKAIVDEILESMMKDEDLKIAFDLWYEQREAVLSTYHSTMPERLPISQLKEFKPIKNRIIQEAVALASFYDKECSYEHGKEQDHIYVQEDVESCDGEYAKWTTEYKQAREYLYATSEIEKDLETAFVLLKEEAGNGNAFAMADLGKMYHVGLGTEINEEISKRWYEKALSVFLAIDEEKENAYLEYRIAKQYQFGLGVEIDLNAAYKYYEASAEKGNNYAQYSLGSMYLHDQEYESALYWLQKSAMQKNVFACYQLAEMLAKGIGCEKDEQKSAYYYEQAYKGFKDSLRKSREDTILYKLGFMCHTGKGCEKDDEEAKTYLKEAVELGNIHAEYLLAKIYLANDDEKIQQEAVQLLLSSSKHKNPLASYQLGKLYQEGHLVKHDTTQAIAYFKEADNNPSACYQLAKIYLDEKSEYHDIQAGIHYLTEAVQSHHEYAQYRLACLLLEGKMLPQDIKKAEALLKASADQGNIQACCKYADLLLDGELLQKNEEQAIHYLHYAAEAESDFAQYQLGRYYLSHDEKEQAVYWLEKSKQAGNTYAQYLFEHMNDINPLLSLSISRLVKHLFQIFDNNADAVMPKQITESKLARKLRKKKQEQGQKFIQ